MGSLPRRRCTVEGCARPAVAKGHCDAHRKQIRRHGRVVQTWRGHVGCRAPGCDRPHYGQGYCRLHLRRVQTYGAPTPKRPSIRQRIASQVEPRGDCLEWNGNRYPNGYGRISYRNKERLVHRLVYELENGPIPPGMVVCHACDNKACVNAAHLFVGTQADNLEDMTRKGRRVTPDRRGERNGRARTTPEQVREVRRLRRETDLTCRVIAERLSLPLSVVEQIASGRTWKHIR